MQKITIAIDGFSSCGKSTLARALAQKLHYNYIDTGAMYRAVTWHGLKHGLITGKAIDSAAIVASLPALEIGFKFNLATHQSDVTLNGTDIEREIRTMEVSEVVSKVAAIKEVREKMVAQQRKLGRSKAVVMDGRDIGTHVFPHAELKLFMTADDDVRARRRLDEYSSRGQYYTLEEVKQSLRERDHDDINRKESPLVRARDAILLDNSDLNREEQLEFVLKLIGDLQLIPRETE